MRRTLALAIPASLALLLATTACGGDNPTPNSAPTGDGSGVVDTSDPSVTPAPSVVTVATGGGSGGGGGAGSWPSPEDCVSYNPDDLVLNDLNDNRTWIVRANSTELVRVYGQQEDGTHALNVAKRYRKVCFIGRGNGRENAADYVFEYWRDPSGIDSPLPDSEDVCRNYDRNNLTVDSMDSDGWRVLDHNDPLGVFDTLDDANDGKLVLSKYSHICEVYSDSEDTLFGVKITYTR